MCSAFKISTATALRSPILPVWCIIIRHLHRHSILLGSARICILPHSQVAQSRVKAHTERKYTENLKQTGPTGFIYVIRVPECQYFALFWQTLSRTPPASHFCRRYILFCSVWLGTVIDLFYSQCGRGGAIWHRDGKWVLHMERKKQTKKTFRKKEKKGALKCFSWPRSK